MTELFWWQAAGLFWAAVCFFRVGAITKRVVATRKVWMEIGQAALIVVVLFGLVTEGRGCRVGGSLEVHSCAATPNDEC
jgi:hypothetical protein